MKAQTPTLRSLRWLGGLLVLGLLGAGIGIAQTPDAPVQLKSISVDRQGDSVTVLVTMSGPAKYAASFIDSPNRLVVDMQGTTFAWNRSALKSDGDPVREVRGSQFRVGTARVVVELSRKVGYRIDERAEGLALVLEPGATAQADKPAPRAKETTKTPATIPAWAKIAPQKVDAQRVAEAFEALKIDLRPAAPKVEPAVAEVPLGTPEPRSAETRMPEVRTSEIRTPEVRAKDALVKPVTLAPIALVPVPAQATPPPPSPPATQPPTGNGQRLISLDFKDADVVNLLRILAAESGRNIVAGDDVKGKVSVSLRNVTWEQALDTILETRGLQKIERGSVIRIVSTEQLTKEREAFARVQEAQVKSESEIRTKRAEAEVKEAEAATKKLQAEAAISEAKARGPLREELIRLSYADPEDVARTLQGILGIPPSGAPIQQIPIITAIPQNPTTVPSSGLPPNPLLRPFPEINAPVPPYMAAPGQQVVSASQDVLAKGITIQAHKPTNSVFIRHYEADLERLKKLIKEQLDIPLPQVKIEARMEILDRTAFEGIGVQWGGAGAANSGNSTLIGQGFQSAPGKNAGTISPAFAGILLPDGTIAPFNPTSPTNLSPVNPNLTLSQLFPISSTTGLPLGGNVVNLPFAGLPNASNAGVPAGGIAFGVVTNRFNINLALQALASQGKTRTLARPEIVTVENNKAAVSLGEEIPYATVSSAGTQIQFKEAVLKLEVTPTVLRERVGDKTITKIKMIVVVENNSRGDTITPAAGVAVPIINRRKAETQVLIKEGDRLVIGGVTQGVVSTTVRKVPLFGDIPIFGWLFKQKENNETGRELVVFVTPSILQGGAGMALTPIAPR
jgi:type IV pilus secretin PilQ/predicted competence protein